MERRPKVTLVTESPQSACARAHTHTHKPTHTHAHIHAHTHTHTHTHTLTHRNTHRHAHIQHVTNSPRLPARERACHLVHARIERLDAPQYADNNHERDELADVRKCGDLHAAPRARMTKLNTSSMPKSTPPDTENTTETPAACLNPRHPTPRRQRHQQEAQAPAHAAAPSSWRNSGSAPPVPP